MYYDQREKDFIIDLFINDFKVFLYNNMVNEVAGTDIPDIDLDNSIKHTIDYLLSRLHYQEEKYSQKEIEEIIESYGGKIVMIDTDMSVGLDFEWFEFMGDLDKEGFDSELVLYNLYNVYPRIASDLNDEEKNKKIQELRKKVGGFIDEWFLDERLLANANQKMLLDKISSNSFKN